MITTIKISLIFIFLLSGISFAETIRYHEKKDGNKYMTVCVNGVPTEMIFDTGASTIALTADAYRKVGSPKITGRGKAYTVAGAVDAVYFNLYSVRLGSYEVENVIAGTNIGLDVNLLGTSFLKHFNYLVNETDKTVTFYPIGNVNIAADLKTIPRKIDNNRLFDKDVIGSKKPRTSIQYPNGSFEFEAR